MGGLEAVTALTYGFGFGGIPSNWRVGEPGWRVAGVDL